MTNIDNLRLDEVQTNRLAQGLEASLLSISQVISSGNNSSIYYLPVILLITFLYNVDEGFCNPDTTDTRYGTYIWPETEVGEIVQMNCVFGSVTDLARVSRECLGIDQWMNGINPGQCFSQVTLEIQSIGVS